MNKDLKLIIIGFMLLILGGILFATFAISKSNAPSSIYVILTYGIFVGPILIVIGVFQHPSK